MEKYPIGELVTCIKGEWEGTSGVVSWPITEKEPGFVLIHSDGKVAGVQTQYDHVQPATCGTQGFTQLAFQLNKLSSYLIGKAIL